MIEVILPSSGPLAGLDNSIISAIVFRLCNTRDFSITNEERRTGRFIKVKDLDSSYVHYVCLSNPDNDGRNSRLMQFYRLRIFNIVKTQIKIKILVSILFLQTVTIKRTMQNYFIDAS